MGTQLFFVPEDAGDRFLSRRIQKRRFVGFLLVIEGSRDFGDLRAGHLIVLDNPLFLETGENRKTSSCTNGTMYGAGDGFLWRVSSVVLLLVSRTPQVERMESVSSIAVGPV